MGFTRSLFGVSVLATAALASGAACAQAGQTVKIAWIDALTGLTAATGQNQLKGFQFLAERFSQSNPAGVKFQIVSFDNKLSPQETVSALQVAIDQGIRYVIGVGEGQPMEPAAHHTAPEALAVQRSAAPPKTQAEPIRASSGRVLSGADREKLASVLRELLDCKRILERAREG